MQSLITLSTVLNVFRNIKFRNIKYRILRFSEDILSMILLMDSTFSSNDIIICGRQIIFGAF
jgi:hypothetical protein